MRRPTGCDLTATGTPASMQIAWDVWFSQNFPAGSKTCRMQLRRTDAAGPALATSPTYTAPSSSTLGLAQEWASYYIDASPTDNRYVLTIQEMTAGNTTTVIWSASKLFRLNPTVTAIASQDVIEVLGSFPGPARVSQYVVEVLMAEDDTQTVPAPPGGVGTDRVRVFGYAG